MAVDIGTEKWFLWNDADFTERASENGAQQDAADFLTSLPLRNGRLEQKIVDEVKLC